MQTAVPYAMYLYDMEKLCRNYRQTGQGNNVRMGNRAKAMRGLGIALNRLLGRIPRYNFWMPQPIRSESTTEADNTGSTPNSLYIWRYHDGVPNARNHDAIFKAAWRPAGSGDCYAERAGGGPSTEETIKTQVTVTTLDLCSHTYSTSYPVARGAAADAEVTDGLITHNGFTCLDVVVQDRALSAFDAADHDYVDPAQAAAGGPVLADLLEDIRAKFHTLRTENLPLVLCWCAQQGASGWATPVATDSTGIVVDGVVLGANTFANALDVTVAARTATSPGILVPAYLSGIGVEEETAGQQVAVQVRVFGEAADDTTIRLIGPDTWANNYTDVVITGGGGAAWYGSSANKFYLDAMSQDANGTTARNKIDIHHAIDSGANKGYCYAIMAWIDT